MQKNKREATGGIISGALSLTISTVIVKILGLVYKIPLSNFLGDEGMGYFNSAYTVYAFFYLLCTAGVPKAVMILVSEAKAKGKAVEEEAIVRVASLAFLIFGSVITASFVTFSSPLSRFIGNEGARATMIAIAPSIIFISLAGVIRGYLSANLRLLDIAVSQIIEGVGKLALGLIFAILAIRRGMSVQMVSAFTILGVTFGAVAGLLYLFICSKNQLSKEKTEQNEEVAINNRAIMKRMLSISVPITLSAAVMSLTNIIDLTLIMRGLRGIGYTDVEASALYGNYTTLAVPMFNLAISLVTPISIAFLPTFTRARVCGNRELLSEALATALRLTSMIAAPLLIGMTLFSREILALLFGNSGVETGATLLCLLTPAIFFSSVLLCVNSALEAGGQVRAPVISMIFGSVAKIFVSSYLLTNSDFGISGAPIGTVISYAVALLVSGIIYLKKASISLPIIRSSLSPYIAAIISVMASRVFYSSVISRLGDMLSLALSILMAAVIYCILLLLTGNLSRAIFEKTAKYTKIPDKNYQLS
ncbi:MAG: polysaccharide biosynthesis protein [Ruminococcaceae bacterium]|nr:polysaccharide biosynthesis protein [Oscillospiraceae bacterium]